MTMLYDIVFLLNLDLKIFNQLDKITIVTHFFLKALTLFLCMNYIQVNSLNKYLVSGFTIFSLNLHSQSK